MTGVGIATALVLALASLQPSPVDPAPPNILAPAAHEVSFGRVTAIVAPGTARVLIALDGRRVAAADVSGRRFSLGVPLPRRDVTLRVTAVAASGAEASSAVRRVYGLPRAAASSKSVPAFQDRPLAVRIRALAASFPGTAAVFVQDLETGAGASWNAGARFPGASTLKVPIAVEVLRVLRGSPRPESRVGRLLRAMLVHSDNAAANELEAWLGGSIPAGAERVSATLRALGLRNSRLYGGFLPVAAGARPPIPVTVEEQPSFGAEKYTTAWDLARLYRYLHLAARRKGPLVQKLPGSFTAADARFLLYLLAHSADRGKLDHLLPRGRATVPHKAGWTSEARHDAGLVYWRGGAFVAVVMTWSPSGVGPSADVLAGKVARAALARFRELRGERPAGPAGSFRSPTMPG